MLTEKSDVYSFGILIMEIITGRSPVDYSRPQGEVRNITNTVNSFEIVSFYCCLHGSLLFPLTVEVGILAG